MCLKQKTLEVIIAAASYPINKTCQSQTDKTNLSVLDSWIIQQSANYNETYNFGLLDTFLCTLYFSGSMTSCRHGALRLRLPLRGTPEPRPLQGNCLWAWWVTNVLCHVVAMLVCGFISDQSTWCFMSTFPLYSCPKTLISWLHTLSKKHTKKNSNFPFRVSTTCHWGILAKVTVTSFTLSQKYLEFEQGHRNEQMYRAWLLCCNLCFSACVQIQTQAQGQMKMLVFVAVVRTQIRNKVVRV